MQLDPTAELLFDYVRDLIYDYENAVLDVDALPEEFNVLGESLIHLGDLVKEARDLTSDMAGGRLNTDPVSTGNTLAVDLKVLQSMLRRVSLQMQKVADGDYTVSMVSYGDISTQAARIVKQLQDNKLALEQETTQNRELSESLLQANSLFEVVTASSSQWIIVMEQSSKQLLFSNHSGANIIDNPEAEELFREWIARRTEESLEWADASGSFSYSYDIGPAELGIARYFKVALYPLKWHNHRSIAFVLNDITESKLHMEQLESIAYHDELTGSFNRHRGMEILNNMVDDHLPFVVCFIDLDDLKYINDVYGHVVGDNYIQTVALLLAEFDTNATVCRLGGDEFMLLSRGWNAKDASARLESMRSRLIESSKNSETICLRPDNAAVVDDPNQRFYSLSYGVVEVGIDNELSASHVLAMADDRMYEYKRAKKLERRKA
jgi:diguanylate cyclase (GGDEF)-like protein